MKEYTRIDSGKFYTLTTGANERRWDKMKERLQTVVDSFEISDNSSSKFFSFLASRRTNAVVNCVHTSEISILNEERSEEVV
ncbi:hypothetical protein Leryth_016402 [Lithospermum erythrorhizon]|nr:hypothetical protein Leryth_016402 [Lithospermum erythrorhizon]